MTLTSVRFPMTPYPNGWYKVAFSDELKAGDVKPLHCFGQELVLFRTSDGTPQIFDAYCPHLGAHLGHGGVVKDNALQCPFHGWCFNLEGRCCEVPYTRHNPRARMKVWPVREINWVVMVYYDADGRSPSWEFPQISELQSDDWVAVKGRDFVLQSHPQELLENFVDTAHFAHLHKSVIASTASLGVSTQGTVLRHKMKAKNMLGLGASSLSTTVSSEYVNSLYGLGFAQTRYQSAEVVGINLVLNFFITPVDDNCIVLSQLILVKKVLCSKLLAKCFTKLLLEKFVNKGLEEDKQMWEQKAFLSSPALCKEEQPIRQYRNWAKQFYAANTLRPSIQSAVQPVLERSYKA